MARTRSAYNRPQIGLKLSKEADEKLAVLASNGHQKQCPTCGNELMTQDIVVSEPVSKSTKAGELLEEFIHKEFDRLQYSGKSKNFSDNAKTSDEKTNLTTMYNHSSIKNKLTELLSLRDNVLITKKEFEILRKKTLGL